ncbi:MAG: BtrH N-terminal domain-containing protein [Candidatus Hodarchaeota archaeon]
MNEQYKNKNVINGILDGFIHKPGVHCITSALRDVFEFHGFNLSEEMLFGLGSGLSLGYINMRGTPDPILGGRSRNPEDIACKRLGVGVKKFTTDNPEEGWLRLKQRLNKGIPSMILIDMAYLPYQDLPEDYHFGQHGIAVCGYNAEKDVVLVSDTAFEEFQEVSTENLMKGRSSTVSKWMDPRNMIYEFSFPSKLTNVNKIIPSALQQAGKNILKPSRFMSLIGITNGLKAIDKFCNDLLKWVNIPKKELYNRCFLLAGYISEFGTGGGAFRYLYSRFLKECSDILDDSSLLDLSQAYSHLGDEWENLARLFREVQEKEMKSDEFTTHFKFITKHLSDIKEFENQNAHLLVSYT